MYQSGRSYNQNAQYSLERDGRWMVFKLERRISGKIQRNVFFQVDDEDLGRRPRSEEETCLTKNHAQNNVAEGGAVENNCFNEGGYFFSLSLK